MCRHMLMVNYSGQIPREWNGCRHGAIVLLGRSYYIVEIEAPERLSAADVLNMFAPFGARGCVRVAS